MDRVTGAVDQITWTSVSWFASVGALTGARKRDMIVADARLIGFSVAAEATTASARP